MTGRKHRLGSFARKKQGQRGGQQLEEGEAVGTSNQGAQRMRWEQEG
jgi:hypothetical protein